MGNPSAAYFQANLARLTSLGLDPRGQDDTVLATAYVFCHAHCRPHVPGWCTVSVVDKTPLAALTEAEAYGEARRLGFYIDGEPWPCAQCGMGVSSRATTLTPSVYEECEAGPERTHRLMPKT